MIFILFFGYLSGLNNSFLNSFKYYFLSMLVFETGAVAKPANDRVAMKFGGFGRGAGLVTAPGILPRMIDKL